MGSDSHRIYNALPTFLTVAVNPSCQLLHSLHRTFDLKEWHFENDLCSSTGALLVPCNTFAPETIMMSNTTGRCLDFALKSHLRGAAHVSHGSLEARRSSSVPELSPEMQGSCDLWENRAPESVCLWCCSPSAFCLSQPPGSGSPQLRPSPVCFESLSNKAQGVFATLYTHFFNFNLTKILSLRSDPFFFINLKLCFLILT